MKFEILSQQHAQQLFDFELDNKAWFESMIAPRGQAFYSKNGIYSHIEAQIKAMASGVSICGVLVKDDLIVARANLRDITAHKASVGYRVAQQFTSQGFASFCLSEIIAKAQALGIRTLEANVLDNNPASKHVLEKQGFKSFSYEPCFLTLNNQPLGCTKYQLVELA